MIKRIIAILFLAAVLGSAAVYILRRESAVTPQGNPDSYFEGYYYEPLEQKRVQCFLCPNHCNLAEGKFAVCKARKNIGGKLYTMNYGRIASLHVDPVEKKPFFHFLPGSNVFSVGTTGCSMRCFFCQNWEISQAFPDDVQTRPATPRQLVDEAVKSGAPVIAFTYNEPVVAFEYMIETFKLAKAKGLRTAVVSSGYIAEEPLRELLKYTDAYKVDLKAFSEKFYRKLTGGHLEDILRTLKIIKESRVWLEIVTLLIPGENDSPEEIRSLARWVRENLGTDVPLHFSRFFPKYKLNNLPPTPPETLIAARSIAMQEGLRFVYTGNVANPEGETTYCPGSGETAIARQGYFITRNNLTDGACPNGEKIPGVWK
ncbi:MAG TPA: AmmeMemoRadiSam system radical SAM enzyme [Candidatus Omnitrophota bacterium]|mgnify:FL=1|jgi:pyruvate formate lyase activating enzyme|nr:AmmeMemoRadiSam system radical SAM enzyme [Candidatus Omnitrophota bacterium]HQB94642.1 AmmeMemoRadiSam system radical SAM enzyme [Candidatus Omnitrophota bacterium]